MFEIGDRVTVVGNELAPLKSLLGCDGTIIDDADGHFFNIEFDKFMGGHNGGGAGTNGYCRGISGAKLQKINASVSFKGKHLIKLT